MTDGEQTTFLPVGASHVPVQNAVKALLNRRNDLLAFATAEGAKAAKSAQAQCVTKKVNEMECARTTQKTKDSDVERSAERTVSLTFPASEFASLYRDMKASYKRGFETQIAGTLARASKEKGKELAGALGVGQRKEFVVDAEKLRGIKEKVVEAQRVGLSCTIDAGCIHPDKPLTGLEKLPPIPSTADYPFHYQCDVKCDPKTGTCKGITTGYIKSNDPDLIRRGLLEIGDKCMVSPRPGGKAAPVMVKR